MRYQLDTIPVWDAIQEDTECPLCALRDRNERMYVESFLGASVMEPDTRIEVNQKGFCAAHFAQMFQEPNRLGLALITDTYLQAVMASVEEVLRKPPTGKRLFGGQEEGPGAAIAARVGGCVLCERLDATMARYAYTLVHLYGHDPEFREAFLAGKGLCLPHLAQVLDIARERLNAGAHRDFVEQVAALTRRNLERVEGELAWFTQKFDYRNQDKPWGESKDAPGRAIQKLAGRPKGSG